MYNSKWVTEHNDEARAMREAAIDQREKPGPKPTPRLSREQIEGIKEKLGI